VFPEAWKFAPRGRVTPSSSEAIKMAREGAVIGNLLLSDSQDIAGVDTPIRQAASVWMLGKQRELNELKRTLAMIPAGISKPKPADVTSLQLGQFIVCTDEAIRTYVQPAWMDDDTAIAIARGERSIDDVHAPRRRPQPVIIDDRQAEAQPTKTEAAPTSAPTPPPRRSPPADPPTPIEEDDAMSKEDVDRLEKAISSMGQQIARALATAKPATATAIPVDRRRRRPAGRGR
jgi:HAMP domain-containing protein